MHGQLRIVANMHNQIGIVANMHGHSDEAFVGHEKIIVVIIIMDQHYDSFHYHQKLYEN